MNALEVIGLKKSFRRDVLAPRVEVLRGVSFTLKRGAVTAFLGANGAGKTTTIKSILGLLRPDSGNILFFDKERLSKSVKARLGFLPERAFFYEYLTGLEFLQFYGELSGKWDRNRALALVERVGLTEAINRRLRFYSKGMLQKVGLAQALLHEPELIILDEPMSGLDPDGRAIVAEIIRDVADKGTSVFFSSHLINDAERLCDRVVMLKDGNAIYDGSIEDLLSQTQRGFQLRLFANGAVVAKKLNDERELQTELKRALAANEEVLEVFPIRMSLEEIFVSRALRVTV